MRKVMILVLMVSLFLLPGCAGTKGQYAAGGAAVGGLIGGMGSAFIPDSGPMQALVPMVTTIIGGGVGYILGSKVEKEEKQENELKQQQLEEAKMLAQVQQSTQLSARVIVENVRNELYPAGNGAQLATILMTKVNPGEQFAVYTKHENETSISKDMLRNGYIPILKPKRNGKHIVLFYQRNNNYAVPMTMEQALGTL